MSCALKSVQQKSQTRGFNTRFSKDVVIGLIYCTCTCFLTLPQRNFYLSKAKRSKVHAKLNRWYQKWVQQIHNGAHRYLIILPPLGINQSCEEDSGEVVH